MEDTLKKADLDLDINEPITDISWKEYAIYDDGLSEEDVEELINSRGISSTDCLEWWLSLRVDANSGEDAESEKWAWYDGNVEEMPEKFKELNGFFNFPEAFKLFKEAKLEKGECLILNFMPEDVADPDWGDVGVLMKEYKDVAEDLELDTVDETEDVLIIMALTKYLEEEENTSADIERAYPEEESGYNSQVYKNNEDDSEWLVCTFDEAESYAKESLESLIDDLGPVEAFGMDTVEYYLDDDYFNDILEEDTRYRVDEMDEDELIDEMESYGIIDDDDKIEDPDWEPDPDEPDEEPEMIYPESLLDSKKEELIDRMIGAYDSGVQYMEEIWGDLSDFIKEHPECVDTDRLIDNMLDSSGVANELARYDGEEHEISYEDEFGNTHWLYAYRID